MRYYTSEMLIEVFAMVASSAFTFSVCLSVSPELSIYSSATARELGTAGKEIWNTVIESIELHRLQKRKKPARSLATQRVS